MIGQLFVFVYRSVLNKNQTHVNICQNVYIKKYALTMKFFVDGKKFTI